MLADALLVVVVVGKNKFLEGDIIRVACLHLFVTANNYNSYLILIYKSI